VDPLGSMEALKSRALTISLSAKAILSKHSRPKIKMKWKTSLELPPPDLQTGSELVRHRLSDQLPPSHDALTMTSHIGDELSSFQGIDGISVTISAPRKLLVGHIFVWGVMVVNGDTPSHRLAIVPVPKRQSSYSQVSLDAASHLNTTTASVRQPPTILEGDRRSDQFPRYHSSCTSELICLSPDIRIGPLAPFASYATELRFLPLIPGLIQLEALRLVDLSSSRSIDVQQLPDIVVQAVA